MFSLHMSQCKLVHIRSDTDGVGAQEGETRRVRNGEHGRYEQAARAPSARRSTGGYTGAPRLIYVTKCMCITYDPYPHVPQGAAAFVPEAVLVEALEVGLSAIFTIASAIEAWRLVAGLPVYQAGFLPPSKEVNGFLERFVIGESISTSLSPPHSQSFGLTRSHKRE